MSDRVRDAVNIAAIPYRITLDPIGSARAAAGAVTGAVQAVTSGVAGVASTAVEDVANVAANVVIALAGAALVVLGVRRTFGG